MPERNGAAAGTVRAALSRGLPATGVQLAWRSAGRGSHVAPRHVARTRQRPAGPLIRPARRVRPEADPREAFVPVFEKMSKLDMLNQYVTHTGGGLFACPGGVADGAFVGQGLFEA